MASKFTGRDYNTLRTEIINFLRERLPNDWDSTNLADPVVVFAESLARVGDQLHYTIDELRRECDVATARRASSIYSYAMREGYKMMLPRASFGELSINSIPEQDGMLHLTLNKFDRIAVISTGDSLYVADNNIDADLHSPINYDYLSSLSDYIDSSGVIDKNKRNLYNAYVEDVYSKTQHVNVVLGSKSEYNFTFSDINADSTVELPNPMIDRNLVRLTYSNSNVSNRELLYVDDVISSGFNKESFTLTPKFIGGAITLNIEFPTNYKDIFTDISTKFKFEYIEIQNKRIDPLSEYSNVGATDFGGAITIVHGYEEDPSIVENGMQYTVNFGNGIKGYSEYEDAGVTRDQYKKFVQNYSSLLTKDDYASYIKTSSSAYCKIFDHGDCYKNPPVLPENTDLLPRVLYIITDAPYEGRANMWRDLVERSSRSDCITLTQFGKDPYSIVVKADCYLVGTSASSVATEIRNALLKYYAGDVGEKIPKTSMIDYLVHRASDKVIRMESLIVRDSTFGTIDTILNNVNQLSNDQIDELFNSFASENYNYVSPLTDNTQLNDDYRYYLRGKVLVNSETGKIISQDEIDNGTADTDNAVYLYYNKYPRLSKLKHIPSNNNSEDNNTEIVISEYGDFPDKFPLIYYVYTSADGVIHDNDPIISYDVLVTHQITYGECDSPTWDRADTDIFTSNEARWSSHEDVWGTFNYTYTPEGGTSITEVAYIKCSDVESYEETQSDDTTVIKYRVKSLTANIYDEDSDLGSVKDTLPQNTILPDYKVYSVKCDYSDDVYTSEIHSGKLVIDEDYIKHHYMVPVINNIIVLIKAVNTK